MDEIECGIKKYFDDECCVNGLVTECESFSVVLLVELAIGYSCFCGFFYVYFSRPIR